MPVKVGEANRAANGVLKYGLVRYQWASVRLPVRRQPRVPIPERGVQYFQLRLRVVVLKSTAYRLGEYVPPASKHLFP